MNRESSRKRVSIRQDARKSRQKDVRKKHIAGRDSLDVERLKINLGHLVAALSSAGKVAACTQIAEQMSKLAGLNNGHSWTWRYVASVHSGSVAPSKKFLRVLKLHLENIKPHRKQWFYFVRRRSLAAVYEKCIMREIITEHMRGMGYKAVSFTRFMEVRKRK